MPSLGPRGDVLSRLRRSLGYTQLQLAQRAGVSERTVRNAERGASIKRDFLEFIASGLGVSVADVVAPPPVADAAHWEQNAEQLLAAIHHVIVEHDASELLALADLDLVLRHEGAVPGLAFEHHMFREFRGVSGLSRFLVACRQFRQACGDADYYFEVPVGGGNLVVLRWGYEVPLRGGVWGWARSVAVCEFASHRVVRVEAFSAAGNGPPETGVLESNSRLAVRRAGRPFVR